MEASLHIQICIQTCVCFYACICYPLLPRVCLLVSAHLKCFWMASLFLVSLGSFSVLGLIAPVTRSEVSVLCSCPFVHRAILLVSKSASSLVIIGLDNKAWIRTFHVFTTGNNNEGSEP